MKEAPTGERFAFYFYGSEPSDWFESEGEEGYAYEVCFQESHSDAERAKIEQTLSTTLQEHGSVFDVQWAGPWLLFRIKPSSDDRDDVRSMFNAARTALQAVHSSFTITEAINAAASEDDSDWNLWTLEAQPIPSPGPKWRSSVPEISGRQRYETTIDNAPDRAARSSDEEGEESDEQEATSATSNEVHTFELEGILRAAAPTVSNAAERARKRMDEGLDRDDEAESYFNYLIHDANGLRLGITFQGTLGVLSGEQVNDLGIKRVTGASVAVRSDEREALVPQQQALWAVSLPDGNKYSIFKHPTARVNAVAYLANDLLAIGLSDSLLLAKRTGDQLEVLTRYTSEVVGLHSLANGQGLGCLDYDFYRVYAVDGNRLKQAGLVSYPTVVEFIDNELIIADDDNACITLANIEETIATAREGSDETFPEPRRWGTIDPNELKEPEFNATINEEYLEPSVRALLHAPPGQLRLGKPDRYFHMAVPSHLPQVYEGATIRALGTNRRYIVQQRPSKRESRLLLLEGEKEILIGEQFPPHVNIHEMKLRSDGKAALLRAKNYSTIEEIEFDTQTKTTVFERQNFYASLFAYLSPEQVIVADGVGKCFVLQRDGSNWTPVKHFQTPTNNQGPGSLATGHKQQVIAVGTWGTVGLLVLGVRNGVLRVLASLPCRSNDLQSVNDKIYGSFSGHYFPLEQLDELLEAAFAPNADETAFPRVEELPIEESAPTAQAQPPIEHSEEEEGEEEEGEGEREEESGESEPAAPEEQKPAGALQREATATEVGLRFLGTDWEPQYPDRGPTRTKFAKGSLSRMLDHKLAVGWNKEGKQFVLSWWDGEKLHKTKLTSKKKGMLPHTMAAPSSCCVVVPGTRQLWKLTFATNEVEKLGMLPNTISPNSPIFPLANGMYFGAPEGDDVEDQPAIIFKCSDGNFDLVQRFYAEGSGLDPEFALGGAVVFLTNYVDNSLETWVLGVKDDRVKRLGFVRPVDEIYPNSSPTAVMVDNENYEITGLEQVYNNAFADGAAAIFDELPTTPKSVSEDSNEEESDDESGEDLGDEENQDEDHSEEDSEDEDTDESDEGSDDEENEDDSEEDYEDDE